MAMDPILEEQLRQRFGIPSPMAGDGGGAGLQGTQGASAVGYANDGSGGAPAAAAPPAVDNSGDPNQVATLQNHIAPIAERSLDLADPPLSVAVDKAKATNDPQPVRDLLKERGYQMPPQRPAMPAGGGYVDPYTQAINHLSEDPFMGGGYVPASEEEAAAMLEDRRADVSARMFDDDPENADQYMDERAKWDQRLEGLPQEYAQMQESAAGRWWDLERSKDAAKARQTGYKALQDEAMGAGYERQAQAGRSVMAEFRQREEAFERREAAYRMASREQMEKYRGALEEAKNFKLDPDRYMSSKGTFGQFRITLALMLGEAGARLGNHENSALKLLNRRIDQDIEAQKAELQGKHAYAKGQANLLGIMRQQFADERQAELAARQFIKERLLTEVESIGQSAKAESVRARADGLKAQLADDIVNSEKERLYSAAQAKEERIAQLQEARRQQQAAAAAAAANAAQKARLAEAGVLDVRDLKKGERDAYVHGIGLVLNDKDREPLMKVSMGFQELSANNRTLTAALNSGDPQALARAQAAAMANMQAYNVMFGDGSALEDAKVKQYGEAFGAAASELASTGNLSGATRAKLEQAQRMAQAKLNRHIRASAVLPGTVSPDGKQFYQTGTIGNASVGGVNFRPVK